jgi:adenine phosphoribosyltransferase
MGHDARWLIEHIRDVPDFPQAGVTFKDITPLLADVDAFRFTIDALADHWAGVEVDRVVGIEARGFIAGAPIAYRLGAGFVPVRKVGKLPWELVGETYDLEYGTDSLEIHRDAIEPGHRVVVIDDVIATGGTAAATCRLVEQLGGEILGIGCIIELGFLHGRAKLAGHEIVSLITYD